MPRALRQGFRRYVSATGLRRRCRRSGAERRLRRSKLVCRPKPTPVAPANPDRYIDLAHPDRDAVAHVARITLNQISACIAAGRQSCGVVEDATVARVRGIPCDVARPLWMA